MLRLVLALPFVLLATAGVAQRKWFMPPVDVDLRARTPPFGGEGSRPVG